MSRFQKHITVTSKHIDDLKHVNNLVYLQWCLDIAIEHYQVKAPKEIKEDYVWVALKHTIEYLKPAFKDDELVVETWVEAYKGAKCIRHYRILKGDVVIVTAKTNWCLLKADSQRPTRIPKVISDLF